MKTKCPHCHTTISLDYKQEVYQLKDSFGLSISQGLCPECDQLIVILNRGRYKWIENEGELVDIDETLVIYPQLISKISDKNIPEQYSKLFNEAYSVLSLSPKSSAALSRRLLQNLLRDHFKIVKRDLYMEIDEFVKIKDVPADIIDAIDYVRDIGNFAAHPKKYQNTGEIVEVEVGEAEWSLDVLEELLNWTFIYPQIQMERKQRFEAKKKTTTN